MIERGENRRWKKGKNMKWKKGEVRMQENFRGKSGVKKEKKIMREK